MLIVYAERDRSIVKKIIADTVIIKMPDHGIEAVGKYPVDDQNTVCGRLYKPGDGGINRIHSIGEGFYAPDDHRIGNDTHRIEPGQFIFGTDRFFMQVGKRQRINLCIEDMQQQ